tara:strand:- start:363 stop:1523 length:1161 start_codon:yes stop_codon:yes gene_type:complete
MINYGKQYLDKKDISAVVSVLKSDWLTQGPKVKEFENSLKNFFGAKYCSVVSNGTAALHLAVKAMGWKKGDYIFTTPNSFLATSNSILYVGAKPIFIDIDPLTFNINVKKLEEKIKINKKKGRRLAGIIATDYAGQPCDWKSLKIIGRKYGLKLINDNCHAIGASFYKNKKYACKYADVVTQSYHPVKNLTTGEGGSILTNHKAIDKKVKLLRSHGVIKKKNKSPWSYEMHDLGFNYRLSDMSCALGLSQLNKVNKFVRKKQKIAQIYDKAFQNIKNIKIPLIKKNIQHSYHLYPLRIEFDKFKISKESFFRTLRKKNINLQVHYIPIFLQPFYKKNFKFNINDLKNSIRFYKEEISLPIYYSLKRKEIDYVINQIKKILKIKNNI